jgi:hypothetical protein
MVAKHSLSLLECMAGTTGLEPATSAVTATRHQWEPRVLEATRKAGIVVTTATVPLHRDELWSTGRVGRPCNAEASGEIGKFVRSVFKRRCHYRTPQ